MGRYRFKVGGLRHHVLASLLFAENEHPSASRYRWKASEVAAAYDPRVTTSACSRALDRLVRDGYVRVVDTGGQRRLTVALTPRGRALIEEIGPMR